MESINMVLACRDPCGNIQSPGDVFFLSLAIVVCLLIHNVPLDIFTWNDFLPPKRISVYIAFVSFHLARHVFALLVVLVSSIYNIHLISISRVKFTCFSSIS